MVRTVDQTAILLATLLKRSEQTRIRIGAKTVRVASRRTLLRVAFMAPLIETLAQQYGIAMFELDTGGYGLIRMSALEAAKSGTLRRLFSQVERKQLRRNDPALFGEFAQNLEQEELETEDDEEE